MTTSVSDIQELMPFMTAEERKFIDDMLASDGKIWRPLPGPQTMAYYSEADVIGFGGSAGGGKTDLLCGKALTQHSVAQIFRREGTELNGIIDRMTEILGHTNGLSRSHPATWRNPSEKTRVIEFGSVPNLGDERKYQGRAKDLLGIDEAANFLEAQVRFLMGWVRTTDPNQRCQTLMTFNPPTSAEGQWIISFFGPWLDKAHPNPAKPGELRWFATLSGKDVEVPDGRHFVMAGDQRLYDFDPEEYTPDEVIRPQSRTFIPSRISDNPYLLNTGYVSTLQALPEPLRGQMLKGDFSAGLKDDDFQVIPSAWVDLAMSRWKEPDRKPEMDSLGVDIARGGMDNTIIARRHGMWFDKPLTYPGKTTPDGPTVAGLVIAAMRDRAPIHLDVIGVGASPYDFLVQAKQDVYGVNVSEACPNLDKSGRLSFFNQRSWLWWKMRETLDPANNTGVALPPDTRLRADLCAPIWELRGMKVKVESRDEIVKRIGRSPDWASAYILANIDTPKRNQMTSAVIDNNGRYDVNDPYKRLNNNKRYDARDPYSNTRGR